MTMNDLKTAAVEEFNKYVLDDYAREYFSDAFDLWEDEPSEYSSINNGYKVIIKRYVQKINVEVEKYVAIMREYTKLTTSESSSSDEELSASKKVLDSATTDTDGEFTQTQRAYPTGYTGSTDAAYTTGQAINSGFTRAQEQNDIELVDVEKSGAMSSGTTSQEIDATARISVLDSFKSMLKLVEQCVFDFVGNKTEGCL